MTMSAIDASHSTTAERWIASRILRDPQHERQIEQPHPDERLQRMQVDSVEETVRRGELVVEFVHVRETVAAMQVVEAIVRNVVTEHDGRHARVKPVLVLIQCWIQCWIGLSSPLLLLQRRKPWLDGSIDERAKSSIYMALKRTAPMSGAGASHAVPAIITCAGSTASTVHAVNSAISVVSSMTSR